MPRILSLALILLALGCPVLAQGPLPHVVPQPLTIPALQPVLYDRQGLSFGVMRPPARMDAYAPLTQPPLTQPPRPPSRPMPWPPVLGKDILAPVPIGHPIGAGRTHDAAFYLYLAALRQRLDCRVMPAGPSCTP